MTQNPSAFIRPSPSAGTLGGVARNTCDSIVLCEAAGYDTILVETVGVGQNEIAVADMVDMFVLVLPPAGGDELQGIKRGIVELADLILINKNDGDLVKAATSAAIEYTSALKYLRRASPWRPRVQKISALTGNGLGEALDTMAKYRDDMREHGYTEHRRALQYREWLWQHVRTALQDTFAADTSVRSALPKTEAAVQARMLTPGLAADRLIEAFFQGKGLRN